MAKQMTRHLRGTSILRARATIYTPNQSGGNASLSPTQTADECPVLHLILGPVHLDLLGLIVDLNQIALDVTAIPGTLLGDIFCQLASGGGSPAHARAG
jgi:hypothetical protein